MEIKEILNKKKEIAIVILVILIMIVISIIASNKEDEIIPFQIMNITITSNVNAVDSNSEPSTDWNLDLYQNNDIYIDFLSNPDGEKINKKNAKIKEIYIDNFVQTERPILGEAISMYKLSDDETKLFEFNDIYKFEEKLSFEVVEKDANVYKKQVNENGGQICLSIVNDRIKNIEVEGEEVKFDGTLLALANVDQKDISFNQSFDLVIITQSNNKYVANINLTLPCADLSGGFGIVEKVDLTNINFKYIEE